MREIKFRVWDYQLGAWAKESEARGSMGFEFGVKDYYNNIAGERAVRWGFMQYTGLLDKNKKEIYEGDKLSWKYDHKLSKHDEVIEDYSLEINGVVIFKDGCFLVQDKKGNASTLQDDDNVSIEVTGNIHDK